MTMVMGALAPRAEAGRPPGAYAGPVTNRRWRRIAHPDRPLLISVLFWADLLTVIGIHVRFPDAAVLGPAPLAAALLLAVLLWPALPWRPAPGRWPAPAAFTLVAGLTAMADGTGASLFLTLIALTSLTLSCGLRAGIIGVAALSVTLGAGVFWVVGKSAGNALYQGFGVLLFGAFVLALTSAVDQARRARDHAAGLAAELSVAHDDLSRYAVRVHALAVAEERTRMARELHDTVGHHLTVIKVGLENAERYRVRDPEAAWQDVRQAKTLTGEALHEVRRGVRALRPPALDGFRGGEALRELARSFDGTGLAVTVAVEGSERPLDETREIVLYRAVQEGLTNALRHSGGTAVVVRLGFTPGAVRLSVTDDGRGAGTAAPGFGLTSLAERVQAAGGTFRAGDREGGGHQVLVDLPVPA
jgi:signal transduction histidine kinase